MTSTTVEIDIRKLSVVERSKIYRRNQGSPKIRLSKLFLEQSGNGNIEESVVELGVPELHGVLIIPETEYMKMLHPKQKG